MMKKKLEDFLIEKKTIYYRCLRCHNEWIPKNRFNLPQTCPKCRSRSWDKPKK